MVSHSPSWIYVSCVANLDCVDEVASYYSLNQLSIKVPPPNLEVADFSLAIAKPMLASIKLIDLPLLCFNRLDLVRSDRGDLDLAFYRKNFETNYKSHLDLVVL